MAYNTKNLKTDASGKPVPQFYNPTADDFQPLTGVDLGGGRYGYDGLLWGKTSGGLYVPLQVNTDGQMQIAGAAADDAAAAGNPLLVAGKYSAAPATRQDGDAVTQQMTATGASHVAAQGMAAHDAAASGNPVQMGGVYRSADPNVADGDVAALRVNAKGEALVSLTGSIPAGTNLMGKVGIDQTTPGTTNGVQLTAITHIQTIVIDALAIADTIEHVSAIIDVRSIQGRKCIYIAHSCDQPITRIGVWVFKESTNPWAALGRIADFTALNILSASGAMIGPDAAATGSTPNYFAVPLLASPVRYLRVGITCAVAPTSGSVTVYVAGVI